ncbi:UNVERIFIED_CONTAM: hypothetical protein HDU68_003748 [Siphonaria sp. JEL0065]|nr:hypothetical protein HDU68_003748 [Siphonaria sp. JEL0065]
MNSCSNSPASLSDANEATPSQPPNSRTYNPHTSRGRPKSTNDAPSKRSGQMRDIQRAHRERKRLYILELEAKAKELETVKLRVAELESRPTSAAATTLSTSTSCINCASEQFKNNLCLEKICILEKRVADLECESEMWKQKAMALSDQTSFAIGKDLPGKDPFAFLFDSDLNVDNAMSIDSLLASQPIPSAEELFGPMDMDTSRRDLRALPSLQGLTVGDELVDAVVAQAKVTQPNQIKIMFFRVIRLLNRVFDACNNVLDRAKATEIVADCMGRNSKHLRYLTNSWGSILKETNPGEHMGSPSTDGFQFNFLRTRLLAIPSLSNAGPQIEEFCNIFGNAMNNQDTDGFFRVHVAISQLEGLCMSNEDRARFLFAFVAAREGNRNRMESLIQKVEESAL